MKIKIEFVAYLNLKGIENQSWIELDHPITISEFLVTHNIRVPQQKYIIPSVNQKTTRLNYILQDMDELFLYLPVGGG